MAYAVKHKPFVLGEAFTQLKFILRLQNNHKFTSCIRFAFYTDIAAVKRDYLLCDSKAEAAAFSFFSGICASVISVE